ncbi:VOC family protein [Sporosarcina sp. CAU 1771]
MRGSVIPHLAFYGEGKEAAEFYSDLLGLEAVYVQKYSDTEVPAPPEAADYLIHCHLQKGDFQLMLADSLEEKPATMKHEVTMMIQCESDEEIERFYDGFRADGEVIMELQDMFWGARYAKVKDKYGFIWNLNFDKLV